MMSLPTVISQIHSSFLSPSKPCNSSFPQPNHCSVLCSVLKSPEEMDWEAGSDSSCYYSVLGIRRDASSEIRGAYRKLALKWHQERWTRNPAVAGEAKKRFQETQEAYSESSRTMNNILRRGLDQSAQPPAEYESLAAAGASTFYWSITKEMTHRPLSVRTNCNLDLQLAPAGIDFLPAMSSGDDTSSITIEMTHRSLSVRTNCNLDLQLPPAGIDFLRATGSGDDTTSAVETPQQLTIFYNGRVCVYDVTELQARAIILTARREMEERMNTPRSEPITPLESQLHSPEGFPMKRSLQQFLHKRKNRIQATSPYKQS